MNENINNTVRIDGVISMNRKGFEMAISTVVMIIIGIAVLIGLILLVTKGFDFFSKGTEPIANAGSVEAVRQACQISCSAENSNAFCCTKFKLQGKDVFCSNKTVNVDCNINCDNVIC